MSEKTELLKNEGIDRLKKVRGKDIVTFTDKGNVKLACKISRDKFLNTLKKSLV